MTNLEAMISQVEKKYNVTRAAARMAVISSVQKVEQLDQLGMTGAEILSAIRKK